MSPVTRRATVPDFDAAQSTTNVRSAASAQVWLSGLLIACCAAAAYSNSLGGPFLFDDKRAIEVNIDLRQGSLWSAVVSWRDGQMSIHPRPIVMFSFAANYLFVGLKPFWYHATNLVIHILAGLTLFGVARRTFCLPQMNPFALVATPLALAIGLIWTLHPLQTEAVTYIVQRYESLMGLFYLWTLYAAIRAMTSPRSGVWACLCVLACSLALGCKEVAVTAPLLVLLFDRTFVAGSFGQAWRRRWKLYCGLAAAVVIMFPMYWRFSGRGFSGSATNHSWLEYARSQPGVILHYLRLCFWPTGQSFDYWWPVATSATEIVPPLVIVFGLLALSAFCIARRPAWGFLGAWFFLILAPTSSILPILDLAAERRMYLPLAAVVSAVVVGAHLLFRSWQLPQSRVWLATLLAATTVTLGTLTFARNRVYADELTAWNDVLATSPANPRAHVEFAVALSRSGKPKEALTHFETAARLEPNPLKLQNLQVNWGACLVQCHLKELAIPHFLLATKALPGDVSADLNLACALAESGYKEAALAVFQGAAQIVPALADERLERETPQPAAFRAAVQSLAAVWGAPPATMLQRPLDECLARYELGVALARGHDHAAALKQFAAAEKLRPAEPLASALAAARAESQRALAKQ
jgi:tetratricopeptide (TPR) repeat protein